MWVLLMLLWKSQLHGMVDSGSGGEVLQHHGDDSIFGMRHAVWNKGTPRGPIHVAAHCQWKAGHKFSSFVGRTLAWTTAFGMTLRGEKFAREFWPMGECGFGSGWVETQGV